MTRHRVIALLVAVSVPLAGGCTIGDVSDRTEETEPPTAFPATVESCGEAVTVRAAPQNVVVNDPAVFELLLELGLQDHLAGYAGAGDQRNIPEQYAEHYANIPALNSEDFTLEDILEADADLVIGGWMQGFSQQTGLTPDALRDAGIPSYALSETCRRVIDNLPPASVDEYFDDVRNIGALFGVSDRADQLISEWQRKILDVQACVSDSPRPPARTVTISGGDDEIAETAPGLTFASFLDRLAGGENIFSDVPRLWGAMSWSAVAERDPEVIVVVDNATGPSPEETLSLIRSRPELNDVEAIVSDRVLVLRRSEVYAGPLLGDGVAARASVMHPDTCG
ncbi:ABC transporter substrate-binding protein [Hoyosella altamirensis]|uniref:Iron complex transport system substrate-binding protein n=1 Tax=Hoyosella altamirensis TaxID=616997 RepID=A0A839RIP1_9ACTN|nr:ABC transporter substrate-binding protein [Hoyosella altamirensis]MBB3036149.1 iron complex transport system substrate-binding protein [Hoyosella altamirensis]